MPKLALKPVRKIVEWPAAGSAQRFPDCGWWVMVERAVARSSFAIFSPEAGPFETLAQAEKEKARLDALDAAPPEPVCNCGKPRDYVTHQQGDPEFHYFVPKGSAPVPVPSKESVAKLVAAPLGPVEPKPKRKITPDESGRRAVAARKVAKARKAKKPAVTP